jgi:DNA-binding NarL/FixJ family response regulator
MISEEKISILLADDHAVVRDGLVRLIGDEPDFMVAGETATGLEAVKLFGELRPHLALVDLKMPGLDGVEVTSAILAQFPTAKVIILTSYSGDVQAARALEAGASGYLLKCSIRTELVLAIRSVLSGKTWVPASVLADIAQHVDADRLTHRELEVLEGISDGLSNKRIAHKLRLSEETVKSYVKSVLSKLQANDRTHAVTIALRRGYLDL